MPAGILHEHQRSEYPAERGSGAKRYQWFDEALQDLSHPDQRRDVSVLNPPEAKQSAWRSTTRQAGSLLMCCPQSAGAVLTCVSPSGRAMRICLAAVFNSTRYCFANGIRIS